MEKTMTFTELMELISEYGTINCKAGSEYNDGERTKLFKQSFEQYCKIMRAVSAAYYPAARAA